MYTIPTWLFPFWRFRGRPSMNAVCVARAATSYARVSSAYPPDYGTMRDYAPLPDKVASPRSSESTSDTSAADAKGQTRPPIRDRAGTISSLTGFDYADNILPLTLSGEDAGSEDRHRHEESKHVGWAQGTALVVGMQVGSGIFSSPGVVVAEVGSPGASLLVWVMSGVLAWTGAR